MNIKNILKQRREELGLTYEELGKMIGVGKSTVRKWEVGTIENMRRDNIVALAKALDISPAVIMGWEPIEKQNKLSKDEQNLINNYNQLNEPGKHKLLEYSNDLVETPKYLYYEADTIAAHDDNLTLEEKNVMDERINEFMKNKK